VSRRAAGAGRKTTSRTARGTELGAATSDTRPEDPCSRSERAAFRGALRRLARRDQSTEELRRALDRQGHTPAAVAQALARLAHARLLDDQAFAERFARRALARGLAGKRIGLALGTRGVPRDLVRLGIERAQQDTPEEAVLDRLAQRYWQRHARIERQRRLRRLWAYLLRRGFSAALVAARLRALAPDLDDALDSLADGSS
jgi:regulatory protein